MSDLREQSGDRYCLFRSGNMWFAVPALTVREVSYRPRMVSVPGSPQLLAGLCHFRNEFLATLSLRPLSGAYEVCESLEAQIIVLNGDNCAWGLLVDEVISLAPLEPSVGSYSAEDDGWSELIAGWATYGDHSVRVLDPQAIYDRAAEVIQTSWQFFEPNVGHTASTNGQKLVTA